MKPHPQQTAVLEDLLPRDQKVPLQDHQEKNLRTVHRALPQGHQDQDRVNVKKKDSTEIQMTVVNFTDALTSEATDSLLLDMTSTAQKD